jgi:HD superfamily phosphohydrolase
LSYTSFDYTSHDCGHGLFSHVSEEWYKWCPEMRILASSDDFTHCKPHEIMSYLIIKSRAFTTFFEKHILARYPVEIDLQDVANYILGKAKSPSKLFLAHIINGPFDIDKVDYIFRDSAFAGLSLTIDLERFLHTLSCHRFDTQTCDVILESPVPAEQILFSKMLLYSLIYHHQKVKACDSQLHALIEYCSDNSVKINGISLQDPADFLYLTDDAFTACSADDSFVNKTVKGLKQRMLFKRAMVLCKDTVSNYDCYMDSVIRLNEDPRRLFDLRRTIRDGLPAGLKRTYSIYDVHISLPTLPSLREASQTYVGGSYLDGNKPVVLDDLFPLSGWISAYGNKQWRGHVFCPGNDLLLKEVHKATRAAFKEKFGLILNNKSWEYCHRKEAELL